MYYNCDNELHHYNHSKAEHALGTKYNYRDSLCVFRPICMHYNKSPSMSNILKPSTATWLLGVIIHMAISNTIHDYISNTIHDYISNTTRQE